MNDDESLEDHISFTDAMKTSVTIEQRQDLFKEICALAEAGVTVFPRATLHGPCHRKQDGPGWS